MNEQIASLVGARPIALSMHWKWVKLPRCDDGLLWFVKPHPSIYHHL
jgi:hypothetical protein